MGSGVKRIGNFRDLNWLVDRGSVLDKSYMESLGKFDLVYSWGVLHHTGAMWLAIEYALRAVSSNGIFYISLYNDQGLRSHIWWIVKYIHNSIPKILKAPYVYSVGFLASFVFIMKYLVKMKPKVIINNWKNKKYKRGMSHVRDMHDWIGGSPYEFVDFDTMKSYLQLRGGSFVAGKRVYSLGCNEFVLKWE